MGEGLEKIKQKILADAEAEVTAIKGETNNKLAEIHERQDAVLQRKHKAGEEHVKDVVELYKNKTLATARLDARRSYLQKKEEKITGFVDYFMRTLDHGSDEYKAFLKKLVDEHASSLGEKITARCHPDDVAMVKGLVDNVEEDAAMKGGVILEDDKGNRVDASLQAVLNRKMTAIRKKIAEQIE